jgi:hypothetical protein
MFFRSLILSRHMPHCRTLWVKGHAGCWSVWFNGVVIFLQLRNILGSHSPGVDSVPNRND